METNQDLRDLYDLSMDYSEQHDLARETPQKVADLDRRLSDYLQSIHAQMPTQNPGYDPSQPASPLERPRPGVRAPP